MRVKAIAKRLVAGTFVAGALMVVVPGLAGATPTGAPPAGVSNTVKPVVKGPGHILAPVIDTLRPNGPGWDGED